MPCETHARGGDGRQVEPLDEAEEDGRRGDDGVGAVGAELEGVAPLGGRHGAELLVEDARGRDVDRLALGRAEALERVDVPAGADEDVDLAELRDGLAERAVDHLFEELLALAVDRLGALEVRLEHPHRAERERHRERRDAVIEQRELGRPTADIDEERPLVADGDPPRDGQLDEPRLFDALDRLDLDARPRARARSIERRAVLRLPDGAGRDGPVSVDLARSISARKPRRASQACPIEPGVSPPRGTPRPRGERARTDVTSRQGSVPSRSGMSASCALGPGDGADASTIRSRIALEPTSMAANLGMNGN